MGEIIFPMLFNQIIEIRGTLIKIFSSFASLLKEVVEKEEV
jgi:hypothetical protein